MVDGESAVLPAPAAFGSADPDDSLPVFESDAPSEARPSRPFQDNGWMDEDHYYDADVPADCYNPREWTETYKDLDEIGMGKYAGWIRAADSRGPAGRQHNLLSLRE